MTEYIKREDAIEAMYKVSDDNLWIPFHNEQLLALEGLPAADVLPVPDGGIGEVSDGYHTFNGLYYQRMVLFATLVKQNKEKAWKSLKHEDGELCFGGGWFIVGIDTPKGSYTYHYEDNFWSMFDCQELPVAKHWDGHTEKDVTRLLSLTDVQSAKWIPVSELLPDSKTEVLVYYEWVGRSGKKYKEIEILTFDEVYKSSITPIAWMPFPKPTEDGET